MLIKNKRRTVIVISCLFVTIIFILLVLHPWLQVRSWNIEEITTPFYVGGGWGNSIALDSQTNVHMCFLNYSNHFAKSFLIYANNVGGKWNYIVYNTTDIWSLYTSIAVDSKNNAHILFQGRMNPQFAGSCIRCITYSNNSWSDSTIDTYCRVESSQAIAIDSHDNLHVCYYDYQHADVKYATNQGGNWSTYVIDYNGSMIGGDASIALDANDGVHISYLSQKGLSYATNMDGTWRTMTIDNAWGDGQYQCADFSPIAVDSKNIVHICYQQRNIELGAAYELKYATNSEGTWRITGMDQMLGLINGNRVLISMAVDSKDKVHIVYPDTTGDLRYASNEFGSWNNYVLDNSLNSTHLTPSIAADRNDVLHVNYIYGQETLGNYDIKLKYAVGEPKPSPPI